MYPARARAGFAKPNIANFMRKYCVYAASLYIVIIGKQANLSSMDYFSSLTWVGRYLESSNGEDEVYGTFGCTYHSGMAETVYSLRGRFCVVNVGWCVYVCNIVPCVHFRVMLLNFLYWLLSLWENFKSIQQNESKVDWLVAVDLLHKIVFNKLTSYWFYFQFVFTF